MPAPSVPRGDGPASVVLQYGPGVDAARNDLDALLLNDNTRLIAVGHGLESASSQPQNTRFVSEGDASSDVVWFLPSWCSLAISSSARLLCQLRCGSVGRHSASDTFARIGGRPCRSFH